MENIKKHVGSVSQEDFILGLLLAHKVETYGDIWEKVIDCNHCKFAKQCAEICSTLDDCGKNPTCGDVINILTGEIALDETH